MTFYSGGSGFSSNDKTAGPRGQDDPELVPAEELLPGFGAESPEPAGLHTDVPLSDATTPFPQPPYSSEPVSPQAEQPAPTDEWAAAGDWQQSQPTVAVADQYSPDSGADGRSEQAWSKPQNHEPGRGSTSLGTERTVSLVALFATLAVVGVGLGLFIVENGHSLWNQVHAWGVLAILAAALTIVPVFADRVRLSAQQAWRVAAGAVAYLLLYWVLLVLPNVGTNVSLLSTAGVVFGAVALWLAPGRPEKRSTRP